MASQTPASRTAPSHQRPSPPPSTPRRTSLNRTASRTQSLHSEDSQTVLLNNSPSESSFPKIGEMSPHNQTSRPSRATSSSSEPRKCWICFADETEDTPITSAWRSPCPCALTAHEACLLDWVADLDAPKRRKRGGRKKVECPQCKAEITIARPQSHIVDGVNAIDAATGRLVIPIILVTLAGGVIAGCWMHGFSTVYVLFGAEDADRVLGLDTQAGMSSNMGLSLPFIPLILVLSRTSLADSVLPILPIFYLGSKIPARQASTLWPPSAAMTIAALPYIRGAYNEFYKRLLAPREQAWIKEVEPRGGDHGEGTTDDNEAAQNGNENEREGGLNFELGLEVEIVEEHEILNQAPAAPNLDHAVPPQPANPPAQPNPAAPAPAEARQPNLILSTSRLADSIVGALIFPSIAATMGGILNLILPRTWTTPPSFFDRRAGGLLQSRLGRSIVGGCLFVALKDAAVLYSHFRLARDQKKRRVLDWAEAHSRDRNVVAD